MPRQYRLTACEAATVTTYLIRRYDLEKDKTTSRARISQQTLRIMAGRYLLRSAFVDDWTDELATVGWSVFPVGDHFGLIQTEATEGWPRIGSKRIKDELRDIHAGDTEHLAEIVKTMQRSRGAERTD
jgi:hypothetical protein